MSEIVYNKYRLIVKQKKVEVNNMEEKAATVLPVRQICLIALMSAVMCLLGPLSIPIGPVPISAMTFIIYLTLYILGMKLGTISCMVYLLLGFVGVPVFAGYTGGAAKLLGPTGGYLVGYIFLTLVGGFVMEKISFKRIWCVTGTIAGTAVLYIFGTIWFVILVKCKLAYALSACVVPFLIGDFAKIILAELVGQELRKRLKTAHLDILP